MPVTRLDAGESLTEVVSGLIMVLTFTLAAGVATGTSPEAARTLLVAVVGCNVAWGVIDAAFYLMNRAFARSRRVRLAREITSAPGDTGALAAIRRELDPDLAAITPMQDRENLYRSILGLLRQSRIERTGLTREDALGALQIFLLVCLTTVPALLPFLVFEDPWRALRASNILLVALLFVVGYHWARYINANPWVAGLGLLGFGLALVAVAIALGG